MSEQEPGRILRLHPEAIAAIILTAVCGLALYIRIALPYDQVFVNDFVWFRDPDAYYYIRNIENMVRNFPRFNIFDPFMLYPGGALGLTRPFFAWLVAGAALVAGGGSPTQHTIEVVAAYMPAVLGVLALVPVYFIGKELFNRWVGIISAALVAILPSEFLHRSLLGFADHHVAETLFSTAAVLFLIMAFKRAREREIAFLHLLGRDWAVIRKPLVYALLAGLFLGMYLISWQGGLMFVLVMFACLLVQFIVDHLRGRSTDYLCIVGTPLFLIAFLMLLPVLEAGSRDAAYRLSMALAIVAPIVLSLISRLLADQGRKPILYPLALLGLAGIALAVLNVANPSLLRYMLGLFNIFVPSGARLTIVEVAPLLWPLGSFSFWLAWANFTTSFFIAFIGLAMLAAILRREPSPDKTAFLVWSIIMLMAVLGQRRFSYYFAVNAALLTGLFSWKVLDLAGLGKLLIGPREIVRAARTLRRRERRARHRARVGTSGQSRDVWVRVVVVGIVVFFVVFSPNIAPCREMAKQPSGIDEAWYSALAWLRDNSPEPFGDPDYYYELYPPRAGFEYPDTAYGVMSWWDYGYHIMQISRRIPNSNPGQAGAGQAAQFFSAQDEGSANEVADRLGSKYVVVDSVMPISFVHALARWTGIGLELFYDTYYHRTQDGGLVQMRLYHPAYYRSVVVRLYNFDGQAVVPAESGVISYTEEERTGRKIVTGYWPLTTYEEAAAYIADQGTDNYRIVSPDPFSSPVPLEKLNSYQLVYESPATVRLGDRVMPRLKIFEYLDHAGS